ncbi:hypothetical protein HU200_027508 [Digitaria exilis]|uniref:Uncharacterized protein n=1 Tax=Digitaria exilis TaxID=1010633 RepID=A0A835C7I5_9POAL|nr:hypothetical protein HU200_027508 [Digitaria exilis]
MMSRYEATRPAKVAADDGGGDGNASFVQTCLNGLNALSGDGLSVPYALSEGGCLSLGLFCHRGHHLLVHRPPPPALHGRRSCRPSGTVPGHRRPRLRPRRLPPRLGIHVRRAVYLVALAFVILDGDNLDKLFPLPGAIVSVSLGGSCSSCLSRS